MKWALELYPLPSLATPTCEAGKADPDCAFVAVQGNKLPLSKPGLEKRFSGVQDEEGVGLAELLLAEVDTATLEIVEDDMLILDDELAPLDEELETVEVDVEELEVEDVEEMSVVEAEVEMIAEVIDDEDDEDTTLEVELETEIELIVEVIEEEDDAPDVELGDRDDVLDETCEDEDRDEETEEELRLQLPKPIWQPEPQ